jgi:hypothetical protein
VVLLTYYYRLVHSDTISFLVLFEGPFSILFHESVDICLLYAIINLFSWTLC